MEDNPDIHSELGFAGPRRFVNRPAPRPVDLNLLRAYHRGELDEEEAVNLDHLIALFYEWHVASGTVLLELAEEIASKQSKKSPEAERGSGETDLPDEDSSG